MADRLAALKGGVLHRIPSNTSVDKLSDEEIGKPAHKPAYQQHLEKQKLGYYLKAGSCLIANILFASSIVFANKAVLTIINFRFVYALTLLHVLTTVFGMLVFAWMGLYERKKLPLQPLVSLSIAFVGYIVFWNISLQVNTVGFYQLSKICITPAVLIFDAMVSKKLPSRRETAAVTVLCVGVALATISDGDMSTNFVGMAVALAAISFTAVYQVFVGSKQRELEVGAMGLMAAYTPIASLMLLILVVSLEPIGISHADADTLIGFAYTPQAIGAIALTAVLGLGVSLTTFLTVGLTSSVTYNVVGHVKTVTILTGGCILFGERISPQTFAGICVAMTGIIWYSYLKITGSHEVPSASSTEAKKHTHQRTGSQSTSDAPLKTPLIGSRPR